MGEETEKPTFEQALERLESIIDEMENGETPLAELVEQFEEGSKLLKICQDRLKEAELKVEQLNPESGETSALGDEDGEEF